MKTTEQKLAQQLAEVSAAVARLGDVGPGCLARVADIMAVASSVDVSRSSFALGQVFEALRPQRELKTLLAKKAQLEKQLNAIADQKAKSASEDAQTGEEPGVEL